jgi:hypothetical protein
VIYEEDGNDGIGADERMVRVEMDSVLLLRRRRENGWD